MKKIKFLLAFIPLIFFTGCWNYNELNELAIVNAIGIDKHKDGYKVTLVIGNGDSTDSSTKEGDAISSLMIGYGDTITECLNEIQTKTSRFLYMAHIRLILISDKVASDSVYSVMDAMFRNPETIKKYQIVIAKNKKAYDFLSLMSPFEPSTSTDISTNIKEDKNTSGKSPNVILSEFLYKVVNDGWDPYMPSIIIDGDPKKANDIKDLERTYVPTTIKLDGIALFNDYKLVGFADGTESKGLNILGNKVENMIISNKCFDNEKKNIVVKLDSIRSKIDVEVREKIKVKILVKSNGSINETNCKIDLTKNDVIKKINKLTEKKVKKIIEKGITKSVSLNSDILGIEYETLKIDKNKKFNLKDVVFDIDVKVNLKTKGSLENTIKEADDEG